jgi:hypothetical protein
MRNGAILCGCVFVLLLGSANAQRASLCGSVPQLSGTLEHDEKLKGELQGKAQLLSRLVGEAELGGQIESSRRTIYQNSERYFAAQQDAYLAYMFCVILMEDTTKTSDQKIKAIQEFRKPPPLSAIENPLTAQERARISGIYSGAVKRRQAGGASVLRGRIYKLILNDNLENGNILMYDNDGAFQFEVVIEGKMVDKRTFVGKSAVIDGRGDYFADSIKITFSPEDERATWYQNDEVYKVEGFGTLFRIKNEEFETRLEIVRSVVSMIDACQYQAQENTFDAFFLVIPIDGTGEVTKELVELNGYEIGSAIMVTSDEDAVFRGIFAGAIRPYLGGYKVVLFDNEKQELIEEDRLGKGTKEFVLNGGIFNNKGKPGEYTLGLEIGGSVNWDSAALWEDGSCRVIISMINDNFGGRSDLH